MACHVLNPRHQHARPIARLHADCVLLAGHSRASTQIASSSPANRASARGVGPVSCPRGPGQRSNPLRINAPARACANLPPAPARDYCWRGLPALPAGSAPHAHPRAFVLPGSQWPATPPAGQARVDREEPTRQQGHDRPHPHETPTPQEGACVTRGARPAGVSGAGVGLAPPHEGGSGST